MKLKAYSIISALAASVLLAGCSDDTFNNAPATADGGTLRFNASDMLPEFIDPSTVMSRSSDPKTQEEKAIRTLHLFFFKPDGTFAEPKYDNFAPYQKLYNTTVLTVPDKDVFGTDTKNLTVVAIANINGSDVVTDDDDEQNRDGNRFLTQWSPGGKIPTGSRDGAPYEITCLEDLQKWVYAPKLRSDEGTDIRFLPKAGMPMLKVETGVDLTKTNGNTVIDMKAMMARVDITVKLEPNQENRTGTLPMMEITGFGIKNLPTSVPFLEPLGWGRIGEEFTSFDDTQVTEADMEDEIMVRPAGGSITINKNSEPVRLSYYTYENIQLPDYEHATLPNSNEPYYTAPYTKDSKPKYPAGVNSGNTTDTQRWKPRLANSERASAMTLEATYTTHQELTYKAKFTVYMGANPSDDFQVKRNHQYTNNITIHGLDYVRNSDQDTYNFDGRVNVVTDNPVYLAIVNERKIDAHATALPMDVWLLYREEGDNGDKGGDFFDWNSTVTITVTDEATGQTPTWLAMEKVTRDRIKELGGFKAGVGARKWFTENLVNELKAANDGTSVGDKIVIDGNTDKSRSRVYFYIDENVDVNNANYGDRVAIVKIEYENNKGGTIDRRDRTIEIEQRALVYVDTWHPLNESWINPSEEINAWMEYYEEYLEHNDPLDMHEQPGEYYTGLPWGLSGESVNEVLRTTGWFPTGTYGSMVYYPDDALAMTRAIIAKYNNDPISDILLFNESTPKSAFHYCYGKNKRDVNGNVDTSRDYGWYMGGIRQLEAALVEHYNTFPNFRTEMYWSCANGRTNNGVTDRGGTEVTDEARATRLQLVGGKLNYIESKQGQDGSRKRTESLRIRAFYKPQ